MKLELTTEEVALLVMSATCIIESLHKDHPHKQRLDTLRTKVHNQSHEQGDCDNIDKDMQKLWLEDNAWTHRN